jgi:hypothetical protein
LSVGDSPRADPVFCLTVTLRRRRLWNPGIFGLAALAAVTGLAMAGCSSPPPPANAVTGGDQSLTIAEAEAGYNSYITVSNQAAAQGNSVQGLSVVGDVQWAVVSGQYTALTAADMPVPQYHYGQPVFYVPALTSYPQWFVVTVPISTEAAGTPGAPVNTAMVFERSGQGQPWTLNGTAALGDQALPTVARDSHGYAIAVTTTDTSLVLSPNVVGATQAAVVDEGSANAAAAVIADGPQTTGLYATQVAYGKVQAGKGLQYQWLLEGTDFPQFQLRTKDGGALVFYGMYLNTTNEYPNGGSGKPIPMPAQYRPLQAAPIGIGYHGVAVNWSYEYVAADPPLTAHNAKVHVIAVGGGPTFAHAW